MFYSASSSCMHKRVEPPARSTPLLYSQMPATPRIYDKRYCNRPTIQPMSSTQHQFWSSSKQPALGEYSTLRHVGIRARAYFGTCIVRGPKCYVSARHRHRAMRTQGHRKKCSAVVIATYNLCSRRIPFRCDPRWACPLAERYTYGGAVSLETIHY